MASNYRDLGLRYITPPSVHSRKLPLDGIEAVSSASGFQEKCSGPVCYGAHETIYGPLWGAFSGNSLLYSGFPGGDAQMQTRMSKALRPLAGAPDVLFYRDDAACARKLDDTLSSWISGRPYPAILYGTPFRLAVWQAMSFIPRGAVTSYQALGESVGYHGCARAIGQAVGSNPLSLFLPCHRVIRSDGQVANYGWGDEIKTRILSEEAGRYRVAV